MSGDRVTWGLISLNDNSKLQPNLTTPKESLILFSLPGAVKSLVSFQAIPALKNTSEKKRQKLQASQEKISAMQKRIMPTLFQLACYMMAAQFFTHMHSAHFVEKRFNLLAKLHEKLSQLREVIQNKIVALSAKPEPALLAFKANATDMASDSSAENDTGSETTTPAVSEETGIDLPTSEDKDIDKATKHSEKALNCFLGCMDTHMALFHKRDAAKNQAALALEKLSELQSRQSSQSGHSLLGKIAKIGELVQRIGEAIQMMDALLDHFDSQAESLIDHVTIPLESTVSTDSATPASTDSAENNLTSDSDSEKEFKSLEDQSHIRYALHMANNQRLDNYLEQLNQLAGSEWEQKTLSPQPKTQKAFSNWKLVGAQKQHPLSEGFPTKGVQNFLPA